MAKKTRAELTLELKASSDKLKASLQKAERNISSFNKNVTKRFNGLNSAIKKIGVTIAAVFAVQKIKNFIGETINLAKEVRGIEAAFRRIPDSASVLETLR